MKHVFLFLSITCLSFSCEKAPSPQRTYVSKEKKAIEQLKNALKAYSSIGRNRVYEDFLCHAVRNAYQQMEKIIFARIKKEVPKSQQAAILKNSFLVAASVDNISHIKRIMAEGQTIFGKAAFRKIKFQALRVGVNNEKTAVISLMLQNSASSDSDSGESALSVAIKANSLPMLKFLLHEKKLSTNIRGPNNFACLLTWVITLNNGLPYAQLLLDYGAALDGALEPPLKLKAKCRPLMHAAIDNKAAAINFLLARGADSRLRMGAGETALHQAAKRGNVESVRALANGAPFINIEQIETALNESSSHPAESCYGAWAQNRLRILPIDIKFKIFQMCASGVDCSLADQSGKTALDVAQIKMEEVNGEQKERYSQIVKILSDQTNLG